MQREARDAKHSLDAAVLTGEGGLHLELYFEALTLASEVERVFISDATGCAEPLAQQLLGTKFQENIKDRALLLSTIKPQLAIVTLPPASTPAAAADALDAGSHVVSEKPGFLDLADFARLRQKAASNELFLLLALPNRLDPYMLEARRLVAAGEIGKIYGLEIHIIADQTRLGQPAYALDWRAHKSTASGGHLAWLGIHWVDLASYITGSRIAAVAAFTANVGGKGFDVEDSAAITMQFESGTLGTLTSGYYLDKGYDTQLKVWGSEGWVLVQKHTGNPLQWYSSREGGEQPRSMRAVAPEAGGIYASFIRAVVRACLGMNPPPLTADDSMAALRVVRACYRAAETGRSQRVA